MHLVWKKEAKGRDKEVPFEIQNMLTPFVMNIFNI